MSLIGHYTYRIGIDPGTFHRFITVQIEKVEVSQHGDLSLLGLNKRTGELILMKAIPAGEWDSCNLESILEEA